MDETILFISNHLMRGKAQRILFKPANPWITVDTEAITLHCRAIRQHKIVMSSKTATRISPNYYLIHVIKNTTMECWCPGYRDARTITLPLAVITLPEGYSIFTQGYIIPTLNTFYLKYKYHYRVNNLNHL